MLEFNAASADRHRIGRRRATTILRANGVLGKLNRACRNDECNSTLAEADFRRHWGLSVVAIQRKGEVVSNPESDFQMQTGDVVVVFGSSAQIAQFDKECGGG